MCPLSPNPDQLSSAIDASLPAHILLIADDLTGACDAAAAFLPAGLSVRVWCGANALSATPESVQALNTESRSLSPEDAARAVSSAISTAAPAPGTLLFKKVDSAARGPMAAELLAAHHALGTRAILLAPAFPAAGRTVHGGTLRIRDAAGQDAQIVLADLFPDCMQMHVQFISRPTQLAAAVAAGMQLLICDSSAQQDLEAIAEAARTIDGLLYAGSAGLAGAIARSYGSSATQPLPASARTLVIAGTPHPLTQLQLQHLQQCRSSRPSPALRVLQVQHRSGDAERIRAEFWACDPQALLLTGGDTALLALHALGAKSIVLHGECAPGVPWGIVQEGAARQCTVITKSGGFGSVTLLSDILNTLTGTA